MTPKHRPLLQHLKRDELLALVDRFAVEVPDRRSKDGLVDALAAEGVRRAPKAPPGPKGRNAQ